MSMEKSKIEKFYTVKEVAERIDAHKTTVARYINSNKIKAEIVEGNGGTQYRISHAALLKFAQQNNIALNLPHDGDSDLFPFSSQTPEQKTSSPLCSSASGFSLIPFVHAEKTAIPKKAKEIALARQDALHLWNDFRNSMENKTSADCDFVLAFNSGVFAPALYAKLGTISRGTLYRWQKELQESGSFQALIPQYNYGSSFGNSTELSAIEKKYFLDLMLQPNKITVGAAHRLIAYMLKKQGIQDIRSYTTYKRFADWFKSKHNDIWTLMRYGQKALIDRVAPYIERDASVLEVGDVLVADGHVLDFQVINPFNGKPCRAMLVGYFDWKSANLAGYEIMLTENTQNIASALRNSIINLGKIPKICYQDNGRAFRAKFFTNTPSFEECGFHGLFGKLGIVPVFAKPYNARAKVIERFFKEFSETGEKLLPSYVGNSPVNKPAYMMRNEKFHKSIHNNSIPTLEQAHQMISAWLEFYRSQPCPHVKGKSIGEVFLEGTGEGVEIDVLDELMMASESRKIGRNGVKFLGNHYFSNELYGITDKVEIRYSLFDLSYIKIYTEKGDYLGKATTVLSIHPMAEILGEKKDVYSFKKAIQDQKQLQKQTINKAKQLVPHLQKHLEWQQEIKTEPLIALQESKKLPTKRKYELVYDENLDLAKKSKRKAVRDLLPYDPNIKFQEKKKYELKYEQL